MNCFILLAHKNPKQVMRLAKTLRSERSDVIIHADSKLPLEEYHAMLSGAEPITGIYFTDRRISGQLDHRSLVDMVLLAIEKAKKIEQTTGRHYSYYALVSGQDYPIKPMTFIEDQLEQSYPKAFIDCTPWDRSNWVYYKFRHSKATAKYANLYTRIPYRFLRIPFSIPLKIVFKLSLNRSTKEKLDRLGVGVYGGSQWWILPDMIIDFVTKEYHKDYVSLLLDECVTPDETFFQIMAMNSPYADLIEVNPKDRVTQNCKTWANFFDTEKPFCGHPYIFTSKDYDNLLDSSCWIARKFDMTMDEMILDLLDTANNNVH